MALRILAIFIVGNYHEPADFEYGQIARNIINGNGFSRATFSEDDVSLTSSHAPIYPYFLAFFYQFGRRPSIFIFIQIIQAVISALTIIIIFGISEIIFNRKVANLSAIGVTFYPVFIFYSTKLVPTIFLIFFLSLSIFLIMKNKKSTLLLIVTGVILGFTILCDPVAFMVVPAVVIWWIAIKRYDFKKLVVIVSIAVLILIPWAVRNYIVHRHFVPVTTQFGLSFWLGNNPNATGTDYFKVNPRSSDDYIFMLQTLPENIRDSFSKIGEFDRSRFYLKEEIDFIGDEPLKSLKLFIKKFYYYWWFAPPGIYASQDIEKYGFLLKIAYFFLLSTGIIGFILSRKFIKDTSLLLMVMFSVSLLYIIAHVGLIRYRVILEPYLIIFVSFCFYSLNMKLKNAGYYSKIEEER